jgi:two-component system, LuxR family, sensor kinase FixL
MQEVIPGDLTNSPDGSAEMGQRLAVSALFRPRVALALAGVLVVGLAALEWHLQFDSSLDIAYTIPLALAAVALNRAQIFLCAVTTAYFLTINATQASLHEQTLRFVMATITYIAGGLLVSEISRSRRVAVNDMKRIQREQRLRKQAEERLRLLVESSPAGVLTISTEGQVLAANRAAAEMMGLSSDALVGRPIEHHLPMLQRALQLRGSRPMRSTTSSWARRDDGTMFPVMTWFSTYYADDQRYMAAIVVDVSEQVREREQENYRHVTDAQRLLAGAVSHEIRNLCSAIAVVIANIERRDGIYSQDPDWTALSNLTEGLSRIASFELKARVQEPAPSLELHDLLEQLRVVIEQDWQDAEAELDIIASPALPLVHADEHGLLQVFLNLTQNALRAVSNARIPGPRHLTISARHDGPRVILSFVDSGPGVANITGLFQPFRPDAEGAGLGLYVSRAMARSFGGDLLHVPTERGCQFNVVLSICPAAEGAVDAALPA